MQTPVGPGISAQVGGPATRQVPLSYGSSGYRFSIVSHGAVGGFQNPSFDDSSWQAGSAAFGTASGQCAIETQDPIRTTWPINTDLLLRTTIAVDPAQDYVVGVVIDNNIQVFWNGVQLAPSQFNHENCATFDSYIFSVPAAYSQGLTSIVLAARAIDDNVGPSIADLTVRLAADGAPPDERFAQCGSDPAQNGAVDCPAEPVNTLTGAYTNSVTDLALPGRGVPFDFARRYSSANSTSGVLGPGWRHAYEQHLVFNVDGSITDIDARGNAIPFLADGNGGWYPAVGVIAAIAPVVGGFEVQRPDLVTDVFDASGRLVAERDRNANQLTFGYTGGDLTSITDTVGRTVSLGYVNHRLTSLTDPLNRQVLYAYDAGGRLSTVRDVGGGLTTYGYDANGRLQSILDPNSHSLVRNTYGGDGRVASQLDALGNATTFSWNAAMRTATMIDARSGAWIAVYNANGTLASKSDPLGRTTSYTYDAMRNVASVTDPRGNTTTSTWDGRGRLLTRVAPAPFYYTTTNEYDQFGNLHGTTNGRGYRTWFYYDAHNNLTRIQLPLANSPSIWLGYDPVGTGDLVSLTDARGKVTTFGYDAQGDLIRITRPLGDAATMTYDPIGRMVARVDPRGNVAGGNPALYTWTYVYDGAGRPLSTTDPLGHTTSVAYDAAGDPISRTDANSHTTTYTYDAGNRLVAVADARGATTTYGYDSVGNLISRTDANGHATTYGYDLAGERTSALLPLGRLWTYAYDPAGNVVSVVDAIGNSTPAVGDGTTTYAYDALDRLSSIGYSDGTAGVTFGYDGAGNRTSMVDTLTTTYTYDPLDRLTAVQRGALTELTYAYDDAGHVTQRSVAYSTAHDIYAYDDDGRLAALQVLSGNQVTAFAYDAAGNLAQTTFPNGYVEARTYDRAGALTEVKATRRSTTVGRATYTLDPVGNPIAITSTDGTTTFTYDASDRLTEACFTAACTGPGDNFRRYSYDDVGNRLTEASVAGTTAHSYDAADELLASTGPGATSYTYDLDGRQTLAGSRSFAYDLAGRLTSTSSGGTTTTYSYDGDGNRRSATSGGAVTNSIWDVNRVVPTLFAEIDGAGTLLRKYDRTASLISMQVAGSPYFFHEDGLGSVLNVTSSKGSVEWTYTYQPYGAARSTTKNDNKAPANLVGFTGAYLDPTGLYHMGAREYDPTTGRFLTRDPGPARVTEPGIASYAYARNNPCRFVDPSGRESRQAGGGGNVVAPAASNPGACLTAVYGGVVLTGANLVITAAGLALQGASVTLFGVSLGAGAPVSSAGILAGLMLEGIAAGSETVAVGAFLQACFNTFGAGR